MSSIWSPLVRDGTFRSMSFRRDRAVGGRARAPGALARHARRRGDGLADAAGVLRAPGVERVVATGNGAAYYVAHALWLASLESGAGGPPLVAVPCGLAVRERFRWRPGDAVLAVSSSGEFRDVVAIAERAGAPPVRGDHRRRALVAGGRGDAPRAPARRRPARRDPHPGAVRAPTRAGSRCGPRSPATPSSPRGRRARRTPRRARSPPRRRGRHEALARLDRPAAAIAAGGGTALGRRARARADAQGGLAHPGRGRRDARGRDVGDVRPRPRPPDGRRSTRPATRSATRRCACAPRPARPRCGCPRSTARTRGWRPITTLPAAAALAAGLALAAGHDVDRPAWTDAYYETARSAT